MQDAGVVFGSMYASALKELSSPDLGKIKLLRDLAKEQPDKASHVVTAISNHLFSCAPSMRLAALYLVDCLLKNVPVPFAPLFEQELPAMFKFVWAGASNDPGLRAKLVKLASTWESQHTLPASVMSSILAIITQPEPPPFTLPAPVGAQSPSPAPPLLWAPPPLPGMSLPPQPILLPPPLQQLPQPQSQPQSLPQPQLQPQPQPGFPPDFQAFMSSQGWSSLPLPPPQFTSQGLPPAPMLSGGQLLPPLPIPPLPFALPPPQQQQAPQPGSDLAATLDSLLSRQFGTQTGAGAASSGAPVQPYQQTPPPPSPWVDHLPMPPTQPQPAIQQPQRINITQSNIKEYCQASVDQLLASSDATRSKFLDLQFLRNRRAKSSTFRSRPWFTTVDQWLEGTRTDHQDGGRSFFAEEGEQGQGGNGAASAEPLPQLVEEDPSQPTCAISGETFERMYDPDTDKWYYEDAMVLWGDEASNAGIMEGSIVKVHCLAGAPAPMSASLGVGLTQEKTTDDVMPALVEAAAGAGADPGGAAGTAVPALTHATLEQLPAPSSEKRKQDEGGLQGALQDGLAAGPQEHQQGQAALPALKRAKVVE